MNEERLDKILIQRGLVANRGEAEKTICEIGVRVNGKLITKQGRKFTEDCVIELVKEDTPFSSIGSAKLEEALKKWSPEIAGKTIMEIGCRDAFTEVLIDRDAKKIYSVGLGFNSLEDEILENDKVVDLNDMLVREINKLTIADELDGCTINQNRHSLSKVFAFIHPIIKKGGFVIALIRVENEVEKLYVAKSGLVKKKNLFYPTIQKVKAAGETNNLEYKGHITSPIIGESGNQEFLMFFTKN